MESRASGPLTAVCPGQGRGVARGDVPGSRCKRLIPLRAWALPLLVVSSFFAVASPAAAVAELPQDIRYHVVFGSRNWTVRWQARAFEQGGLYRLYAGQSRDSLRLVDVQNAVRGIGSYQFSDGPDGSTQLYYQLRYLIPDGEELVLGTLRLDLEGLGSLPVSVELGGPGLKALHEVWSPLSLASNRLVRTLEAGLPRAEPPRPEVPPPRPGV